MSGIGRKNEESPVDRVSSFLRPQLDDAALHGLPGLVVDTIAPHTEADRAGLLLSFLTMFGNLAGAGPHAALGQSPQPGRLFVVLVGDTATGRKGTAGDEIEALLARAAPAWSERSITHGLQSAEALVDAVDDSSGTRRLMVIETEFGRVLHTMSRRENLADTLNLAFDGKTLRVRTKAREGWRTATRAHVSVLGHVTPMVLFDRLSQTAFASGFANRFLFAHVKRSKLLSRPTRPSETALEGLVVKLGAAVEWVDDFGFADLDPISAHMYRYADRQPQRALPLADATWDRWDHVYPELATPAAGVVGEITARAPTQVIRLATIYAIAAQCPDIRTEHLEAGLAVWRFCEASVRGVFGGITGDRDVDRMLRALSSAPNRTMSTTDVYSLFNRNLTARQIGAILDRLPPDLVVVHRESTGGRPRTTFTLRDEKTNEGDPHADRP